MKAVFCLFAVALVAVSARPDDHYTDRYDTVDVGEILANKKVLVSHIKCVLDEGKCSAEGKELKSHIKEALENNCGNCTEAQRAGTRRVIGHLINEEPEYWQQLCTKYDKDGKYAAKYEAELKTVKKN